ncbi:hypothetical protein NC652_034774 [Populus alba x Populus x berolinensis]|nr:hypothetical protein NC652_034774 [Populus alba x Populus x berolinensis]
MEKWFMGHLIIHVKVIMTGLKDDVPVENALINIYMKCSYSGNKDAPSQNLKASRVDSTWWIHQCRCWQAELVATTVKLCPMYQSEPYLKLWRSAGEDKKISSVEEKWAEHGDIPGFWDG